MRLSVIIPTIGRASLLDALASCARAEEVIVVADEAAGPIVLPALPASVSVTRVRGGDHGYTARRAGMAAASGTHLAFLDDDDVFADDAVALMRQHACDRPVIFRMDHPEHGVLWRERELAFGNVGTPMFLVPNKPKQLGRWAEHAPGLPEPGGDFTFIRECCTFMGDPVWRPEIVAVVKPDGRGPSVAIVTPWLDHPELAEDYLEAVQVMRPDDELIILDNASDPPLVQQVPALNVPRDNRSVHRMPDNWGYAGASNVGFGLASADAVVFLNNDVRMTRLDWLAQLRGALEPGVLVGAAIRWGTHGDVDSEKFPYIDGWCIAGMHADLERLGGFDEGYVEPAYYSDNDLCLRARLAGMRLREVRIGLLHITSRTSGPDSNPEKLAAIKHNKEMFKSRVNELWKEVA